MAMGSQTDLPYTSTEGGYDRAGDADIFPGFVQGDKLNQFGLNGHGAK